MKMFAIGPGLSCNLDRLVDTRLLVQANSGGGKSWLLRRLLEQTHGAVQHLVIDPEGEFASLRERFDYVHAAKSGGDTAADPRAAALLAERLLELKVSAILDIYELKAHERVRFVKLFLDALVNAPKTLWHPALVILDEAHVYCPEQGNAESAGAVIDLATRGRKRGFSIVLATQRLAKLHKDAAAECNNKLIGRTTLDVDVKRAANELGLSEKDARLTLRQLTAGEFFAYGPAFAGEMNASGVIQARAGAVVTTHPKAGGHRKFEAPPPTAAITKLLPNLKDLPAEAEERARSVADLHKDIANLRRELTAARKAQPTERAPTKADTEKGEKLTDLKQTLTRYRRALEEAMKIVVKVKAVDFPIESDEDRKALEQAVAAAVRQVTAPIEKRVTALAARVEGIKKTAGEAERAIATLLDEKIDLSVRVQKAAPYTVAPARATQPLRPTRAVEGNGIVTPARQRILNALAFFHGIGVKKVDKIQLALMSGVPHTSGGYKNNLGALRSDGYIDYPSAGDVALTETGHTQAVADNVPTTTDELHRAIQNKLPPAKWKIVETLIGAYPDAVSKADLASACDVPETSGGYKNNLGSLRSLGLIDYPSAGVVKAQAVLFLEDRQ